ncbi:hypothetical protein C8Q70DRAFT_541623 [Cubamyces menziesii]|nr:hypothetical protein C8Q70DRAFT_541623 [Cubamyces menziesii]
MVDWQPDVVLRWVRDLVDIDSSGFGSLRDHFWSDRCMLGAISWCNVVLSSIQVETKGNRYGRFARTVEVAAIERQRCFRHWLVVPSQHSCADEVDHEGLWWRQMCWLLTTTFELTFPQCEPSGTRCPCHQLRWPSIEMGTEQHFRQGLERPHSNDREAETTVIPTERLRASAALDATAAIRGIQRSGYSPHVPLDSLRDFLHPCAHLLCTIPAYELSVCNYDGRATSDGAIASSDFALCVL